MDYKNRESVREFLKENDIREMLELDMFIREMKGALLEEMLDGERDAFLGYSRYDSSNKETDNSRNGYTPKTVRSTHGSIEVDIPRDRDGDFEPELIRKYQRDITQIEDKIISMYARGMTVRDIQSHLEEIYGASISPQTISKMTDRILPKVEEWRNRPLQELYSIVYIDGQRYKVRSDGQVKDKTVYVVMGIDMDGRKDILGLWISETESAKYWLKVMTDLKNRGVKDILIITSDDLSGIENAIQAVYPDAEYQVCVVHVIRNSLKYVSHQDKKDFSRDMKLVYKAATEESALVALDELKDQWGDEYPLAISVWERNWDRIRTMFRFTEEIRRLIYTTNPIESFHRQLRKVTKNRSLFPSDTSVLKLLYLATCEVLKKWTVKLPHWNRILAQLSIHFGERVEKYL